MCPVKKIAQLSFSDATRIDTHALVFFIALTVKSEVHVKRTCTAIIFGLWLEKRVTRWLLFRSQRSSSAADSAAQTNYTPD